MRGLRILTKIVLILAALPVGLILLIGLPLGLFGLLMFVGREVNVALFVPGVAVYVFLFCLPVGIYHWVRRSARKPSGPFVPPSPFLLGGIGAAAIAVGAIVLAVRRAEIFWLWFLLAATMPPATALAIGARRLGTTTTWRRLFAGIISGSLLSTHLTVLLSATVTLLAYLLVVPLRATLASALASGSLEKLFYSPALVFLIVEAALVAPLVEELTKPIAAILLARRLRGPAEAFLVGMAGGAGFAVLENMLYEAAGVQLWAGIAALRAVGAVLHPLNAGLVAVGWYGVRTGMPGAWGRLAALYGLAVGLHSLWNGGLVVLTSDVGAYFFGADQWQVSVYGVGQPGVVLLFMLLEAVVLWRLLFLATGWLRSPLGDGSDSLVTLRLHEPRRLALFAGGALALLVPAAALYGPLIARWLAIATPIR